MDEPRPAPSTPAAAQQAQAAAAAAAPATPLQQRTWRKAAQRAQRLALTAFKEAATRSAEANAAGQQAATELANTVLTAMHLSAMPLGALAGIAGLPQAAAGKLQARAAAQLRALHGAWDRQAPALQGMQAALADLEACLDQPAWQQALPVFQALSLPAAATLLRQVSGMHAAELALKGQLLAGFHAEVDGCQALRPQVAAAGARLPAASKEDEEAARERLTVYIATWLSRAHLDEGRIGHSLGVLTDDMAGF